MKYTVPQLVFMYDSYIVTESLKKAQKQFKEKFADVSPPRKSFINNVVKNVRKTGTVFVKKKKKTDSKKKKGKKKSLKTKNDSPMVDIKSESNSNAEMNTDVSLDSVIKSDVVTEDSHASEETNIKEELVAVKMEPEESDGINSSVSFHPEIEKVFIKQEEDCE